MIYTVEIYRKPDIFVKGPFETKDEAEAEALRYHDHLSATELRAIRKGERAISVMTFRDEEQMECGEDAEDVEDIEDILERIHPSELETVAKVTTIGSSLGLYLTKELQSMGLQRGDHVKVILERIE